MWTKIKQRWASKTYKLALFGTILSAVEINVGLVSTLVPEAYRAWAVMFWPVLMLVAREMTTTALSEK